MNRVKNQSEQLTFNQLLSKYVVEIPIIQRDYAQGRKTKSALRKSFLFALKNGIVGDPIELDFIYGDVTDKAFQPLDGQQRLTTLFLLYWYAAMRGNKDPDEYQFLKNFTYKTRISSRDFCRDLASIGVSFSGYRSPSEAIRDSEWYSLSWDRDPTVTGMLNTLDDIRSIFLDLENLWEQLIRDNNPPITFHCVVLDDFGLSDDLYIKMNARGKPLTEFENFKALFEKRIKNEGWDEHRPRQEHFDILVDTAWTELFWKQFVITKYEKDNLKLEPRGVDEAILKFITNALILSLSLSDEKKENELSRLRLGSTDSLKADNFSKQAYEYLYKSLQVHSKFSQDHLKVTFSWHRLLRDDETLLLVVCGKLPTSFAHRLLFFAQTEFLVATMEKFETVNYQDWIRVVRNIIRNSSIENYASFLGALSLIRELSAGCQNIYEFLISTDIKSRFAREQIKEEVIKAALIVSVPDESFKLILHDLEDSHFCEGNLSFPLHYAKDISSGIIQKNRLVEVREVIKRDFQHGLNDTIRRALLTIDSGQFFRYWHSWLYASNCPKYRLIENMEDMRSFLKSGGLLESFKKLFEKLRNETPDQLIENFEPSKKTPPWQTLLIKEPQWLSMARKKYIAFDDKWDHCFLIEGSKVTNDDAGRKRLIKVAKEVEVEQ